MTNFSRNSYQKSVMLIEKSKKKTKQIIGFNDILPISFLGCVLFPKPEAKQTNLWVKGA